MKKQRKRYWWPVGAIVVGVLFICRAVIYDSDRFVRGAIVHPIQYIIAGATFIAAGVVSLLITNK
jgi:drug/metabolite transporter (DMT)-like permease